MMEKGISAQLPAAVRSGAMHPHRPSPGTCTPLSTQREQPVHQKLHLLLDASLPSIATKLRDECFELF